MKKLFLILIISVLAICHTKADEKKDDGPMKSSTFSGLKFRSIGPSVTGGRVSDFAVNPYDKSDFYVAFAAGNIFKTTNGGITFTPVFENYGSYSIGDLAIDPKNPNVVWAGSGENNSQRSVAWGDGIYKTTDGGRSWKNMGLKDSEHIGRIIIHPENSDVVYVAAQGPLWGPGGDRGLYVTKDGGKNWEKILEISENTGVTDLIMDPRDPKVMYAASYQRRRHVWTLINGGPESAIYKTVDGGENWEKLSSGLPGGDVGRIGLAISPQKPDVVYAIIEAAEGKSGFFRSSNRGASWDKMNSRISRSPQYYQEIYCDPFEFDVVYSLNTYTMVTKDGGKNWDRVSLKERHVDDHAIWFDPDDPDHMLIGGDGGVYESFDDGEHWRFFGNLPVTQYYRIQADNSKPFYYVYGGTQDNNTLAGPSRTTSANGITNEDWFFVVGGDGYEPQIDPENPDIVYGQWQYGFLVRYDRKSGEITGIKPKEEEGEELRWNWDTPLIISPHDNKTLYFAANKLFKSTDRGNTWEKISGDLTRDLNRNELEVMGKVWPPEAVAKNQSTSLYGNIVSLAESPVQKGLIYVGTDDGLIQVTEDDGAKWRKISNVGGLPDKIYVSDIYASRHDANVVYALFNDHKTNDFKPYVFKSNDKGKTWTSISSNLPENEPVWTIEEDFEDPKLLFVGTEFGLYFTNDGGNKWVELSAGLPTIAVRDLDIQEREGDLVVGTFGRGIYILDDYSPLRHAKPEALENEAKIFPIKDALAFLEDNSKARRNYGSAFYRADNPPVAATFTYYLKDSYKTLKAERKDEESKVIEQGGTISYPSFERLREEDLEEKPYLLFVIKDKNGKTIRQLKKSPSKGIKRVTWDLRYASEYPVTEKTDINKASGMPVVPGEYSVELYKFHRNEFTKLDGPVKFNVVPLNNVTLPADDANALADFQDEVLDLQGTLQAVNKTINEMMDRTKSIKNAISLTDAAPLDMIQKTNQAIAQLQELDKRVNGDESISKRAGNQTPSISDRLGIMVYLMWRTRSAPTTTNKEAFAIAEKQTKEVIAELRGLRDSVILPLEEELESLDAPLTPGRFPIWD